jgi:hypothetical protein
MAGSALSAGYARSRHNPGRVRDALYGAVVKRRLRGLGIRDRPIVPQSPWQNGHVERLIGSIWRECLDHTHLALDKDAPITWPIERKGRIIATQPMLDGLHHRYARI